MTTRRCLSCRPRSPRRGHPRRRDPAHGDELGRTRQGNNNVYCQDNTLSWIDWELDEEREGLLEFTRRLVALRHGQPALRRRRFLRGPEEQGGRVEEAEAVWLRTDGELMAEDDWVRDDTHALALYLCGDEIRGEETTDPARPQ
ncbi:hypothetical protein [Streptomyces sp. NPDC101178]|uniref:hypothetical protein n=1 Tax=Streptomyces sp. NPDC101178 TaxID=3366124 RepID=UPI003808C819